jgi:hypothetical protein
MGREQGLCRGIEYGIRIPGRRQLYLFVAWNSRCAARVWLAWRERWGIGKRRMRRATHRKSRLRFAGSIMNSMSCTSSSKKRRKYYFWTEELTSSLSSDASLPSPIIASSASASASGVASSPSSVSSACACGAVTSAGGRIGGNKSSSAAGGSDTALPNGMLKKKW